MRFKALSNKGKVRRANEDNYYTDKNIKFFMVADGMGGHAAGEVASDIAVSVSSEFNFDFSNLLNSLEELTLKINSVIIKKSKANPDYSGMGTTFAAAVIKENELYYVNLGDSRIYLYNKIKKSLKQISQDHSLVANLINEGEITKEEAFNHPQKNVLTQALGLEDNLDLDKGKIRLSENNTLLLCTDGLSDMIRKEKLEDIFSCTDNLEKIEKNLFNEALAEGGLDNITFIIVDFDKEDIFK